MALNISPAFPHHSRDRSAGRVLVRRLPRYMASSSYRPVNYRQRARVAIDRYYKVASTEGGALSRLIAGVDDGNRDLFSLCNVEGGEFIDFRAADRRSSRRLQPPTWPGLHGHDATPSLSPV